ncbi:MAG TPA: DUF2339 domain-containing protein, partial [Burkholderiales bacterium]|nr:DUF2339 domain-containing protein [Burkholderiales bacterium]
NASVDPSPVSEAPAQRPAHESSESVPDGNNPAALQAYLHALTTRVQALEKELHLVKGGSIRAPEPEARATPERMHDVLRDQTAHAPAIDPVPMAKPASIAPTASAASPASATASMISNGLELNAPAVPLRKKVDPVHADTPHGGRASIPPERPVQPAEPSFFSRLISGNIVAKVGAIILFFGVGFLLKFAYERNMVSPEMRLFGVALSALVVFVLGLRFRARRRLYGVILQGVASGLAYLDVFFALKTYGFISAPVGFSLFAVLGVITTLLAVRQDAKPLAVLGLTGAFMAPVLASTGGGNVKFLFTYYLLLNAFILAVSWFRSWRVLNLTGWFFTFAVAVIWGARSYRPELFSTVEPFLIAFFVIYLIIPILFAMRQPPELKGLVDGTLVFGTPAAVAALQGRLVWDMPYGLAWSCAVGALLYGLLSLGVFRHKNMKLLGETYVALAVGLGTLSIFYAFGAYTTFALWTIEGTAILWVCLRQKHLPGRLFAILVQFAGAAYFLLDYTRYPRFNPYFNDAVLGCAIIAAGSFISAALYRKYREEITAGENTLAGFILAWGALCWSLGGLDVIHYAIEGTPLKIAAAILFFSATAVVAELWGARIGWGALRGLTVMHPPILLGAAVLLLTQYSHPLADLGWFAWPVGLATLFWMLHRQRRDDFRVALEARYIGGWLILAGLATWEALWWMDRREYVNVMIIALVGYVAAGLRFGLRERGNDTRQLSTLVLLWAMLFWFAAGLSWIHQHYPAEIHVRAALLFVTLSSFVYSSLDRIEWPALRMAARLPWLAIPAALLVEIFEHSQGYHPFGDMWALVWPLALGLASWRLRREESQGELFATVVRHTVMLYTPIVLVTWELVWWLVDRQFGGAWQLAGLAIPASVVILWVVTSRDSERWPLKPHALLYRDALVLPLASGLLVFSLIANVRTPGSLAPLSSYIPIFNPIDLAIALAAFALVRWGRIIASVEGRHLLWRVMAILGFLWVNAIALRTIHYWAGVPYRFADLMTSVLVQATLSILWTSTAFGLMLLARRRMERAFWIAGAALLTVVVGKLFLVDLANTGTVARIVSFLGVGVLLLVIGYAAPVPPGVKEAEGHS